MTKRDTEGRITEISLDDPITSGHSVCYNCRKDMPSCWDVVCFTCHKTCCYDCSEAKGGKWYCLGHA